MTTPSAATAQQQLSSKPQRRSRNKAKADVPTKAATDQFCKPPAVKAASNGTASDNDLAHTQKEKAPELQQSSSTTCGGSASGNPPTKLLQQALAAAVHPKQQIAQLSDCETVADSTMPSRMPGRQQPSQQQQPGAHASSQEQQAPQQAPQHTKPPNGKTEPTARGPPHAKTTTHNGGGSGPSHNNGSTSKPGELPPARGSGSVGNSNGVAAGPNASPISSESTGWEGKTSWEVENDKRHQQQLAATSQAAKKKYVDVAHSGSAKPAAAAQTAYRPKAVAKQPAGGADAFPPLPSAPELRMASGDTGSRPQGAAASGSAAAAEDRKVGAAAAGQVNASVAGPAAGSDDSRPVTSAALPGEVSEGKAALGGSSSCSKGIGGDRRSLADSRRQDWVPKPRQGAPGSRTSSSAPSSGGHAARPAAGVSGSVTAAAAPSKQAVEGRLPDARVPAVPAAVPPAAMPPNPSSALAAKASVSTVQQQQQPPQVPVSAPAAPGLNLPSLQEVNMAVNSSRSSGTNSMTVSGHQSLDVAAAADVHAPRLSGDNTCMQGSSSSSSSTNRSSAATAVGCAQQHQQQRQHPHTQLEPSVASPAGTMDEQAQATACSAVAITGNLAPGQQQQQHLPPAYVAGHLTASAGSGGGISGGSGGGSAAAISRRLSADAPPFVVARSAAGHSQPGPQGHEGRSGAGGLSGAANPTTAGDSSACLRPGSAALSSAVLEQQWLENAKAAAAGTSSRTSGIARPTTADGVMSSGSSMRAAVGVGASSRKSAMLLQELADALQAEQQAWERQQSDIASKQYELLQQQQHDAAACAAAEKKAAELEEALDAARKAAQEFEAKLSLQSSQVDTLKSDFATAMAAKHEACKEAAAAHSQVSTLQQQLSELEAANVHLRQQLNDWQRSYAVVERENGQMRHLLGTNAPAPGSLPPAVALPSAPAAAGSGSDAVSDGSFAGSKGGAVAASGAKAPPPGFGPVAPTPVVCAAQPEQQQVYIKNEHELVLTILPVLREGVENAVQWTAAELAAVNAQLVPLSWEGNYEAVYGSIDYFMQQRPAVFGCGGDGLFYKQQGAELLVHSNMRREQEEAAAAAAAEETAAAAPPSHTVPTQFGHGSWNQLPAADVASSGSSFQLPMDQQRLPGPGPASALPATAAGGPEWGQPTHNRATGPPAAVAAHHAGMMVGPPPVSMALPQQQFWPTSMPASAHVPVAMSMPAAAPLPFTTGVVPYPYTNTGYRNW